MTVVRDCVSSAGGIVSTEVTTEWSYPTAIQHVLDEKKMKNGTTHLLKTHSRINYGRSKCRRPSDRYLTKKEKQQDKSENERKGLKGEQNRRNTRNEFNQ